LSAIIGLYRDKIQLDNYNEGVADFDNESAFIPFLKSRLKLIFGCVQSWYS
jgi:hypothetical protein